LYGDNVIYLSTGNADNQRSALSDKGLSRTGYRDVFEAYGADSADHSSANDLVVGGAGDDRIVSIHVSMIDKRER
jgi:hypothetical protein